MPHGFRPRLNRLTTQESCHFIKQLGSDSFEEREAASKALESIGEPARRALEKAAIDSDDAEVKRRIGTLFEALDAALVGECHAFRGHTDWVSQVSISPDGKRIVCSSWDNTVKVWDADKGTEILTLNGHTSAVTSVAFSADGKRIVSGSADNTVKVWDADKGTETSRSRGTQNCVNSVAFSPDGKRIVTRQRRQHGEGLGRGHGHRGSHSQGHTEPSHQRGVQPGWQTHRLRQLGQDGEGVGRQTRAPKSALSRDTRAVVSSVAFSPDGKRIVSGSGDKTLKVWDADKGTETLSLKGHTNCVTSVAFSPDGKRIVSGSLDDTVKLWDADNGTEIRTLKDHKCKVLGVSFSLDNKRIVSGGATTCFGNGVFLQNSCLQRRDSVGTRLPSQDQRKIQDSSRRGTNLAPASGVHLNTWKAALPVLVLRLSRGSRMRADMAKVIVERPRLKGWAWNKPKGYQRQLRAVARKDRHPERGSRLAGKAGPRVSMSTSARCAATSTSRWADRGTRFTPRFAPTSTAAPLSRNTSTRTSSSTSPGTSSSSTASRATAMAASSMASLFSNSGTRTGTSVRAPAFSGA